MGWKEKKQKPSKRGVEDPGRKTVDDGSVTGAPGLHGGMEAHSRRVGGRRGEARRGGSCTSQAEFMLSRVPARCQQGPGTRYFASCRAPPRIGRYLVQSAAARARAGCPVMSRWPSRSHRFQPEVNGSRSAAVH